MARLNEISSVKIKTFQFFLLPTPVCRGQEAFFHTRLKSHRTIGGLNMGLFSQLPTCFSDTLYIFFLVYVKEKAVIYVFHAKPFFLQCCKLYLAA